MTKYRTNNMWEEYPVYFTDKHAAISMTLRDHFAGLAMQGMIGKYAASTPYEDYARGAYKMADAMLVEREEKL